MFSLAVTRDCCRGNITTGRHWDGCWITLVLEGVRKDPLSLALCVTLDHSNIASFHWRWNRLYLQHDCVKCNRQTTKRMHTALGLIFTILDASFPAQGSDPSLVWVEMLLIFVWNWKSWHWSHDHWERSGFLLVPTCHPTGTSQTSHSSDAPFFSLPLCQLRWSCFGQKDTANHQFRPTLWNTKSNRRLLNCRFGRRAQKLGELNSIKCTLAPRPGISTKTQNSIKKRL